MRFNDYLEIHKNDNNVVLNESGFMGWSDDTLNEGVKDISADVYAWVKLKMKSKTIKKISRAIAKNTIATYTLSGKAREKAEKQAKSKNDILKGKKDIIIKKMELIVKDRSGWLDKAKSLSILNGQMEYYNLLTKALKKHKTGTKELNKALEMFKNTKRKSKELTIKIENDAKKANKEAENIDKTVTPTDPPTDTKKKKKKKKTSE